MKHILIAIGAMFALLGTLYFVMPPEANQPLVSDELLFGAWAAVENFNSYSDGALSGNNGGSGWSAAWTEDAGTAWDVQGTTVYEGAKAIIMDGATSGAGRSLTSAITGDGNIVYVALRKGTVDDGRLTVLFRTGSSERANIIVTPTGDDILLEGVPGNVTIVDTYSAGQWYVLRITLNITANTFTAAYSTDAYQSGGSWSSESAAAGMQNTGDIDNIRITSDTSTGADYIDYISSVDPLPAAGGGGPGVIILFE